MTLHRPRGGESELKVTQKMSSKTVAEFANELKKSTDTLLDQLKSAGVAKSAASDPLTELDKQRLLSYLQASHGTATGERKKITLVKKSTTEIKQADASGKARTIQVEVRKKRTFVRRDDALDAPAEAPEHEVEQDVTPEIDHAELSRREEEASKQAELIRRQEEELAERRRQREAQEAAAQQVAEAAAAKAAQVAEALAQAQRQAQQAQVKTSNSAAADTAARAANEAAVAEAQAKASAEMQANALAKEKAAVESQTRVADEQARALDLTDRRRKAEAEAAAIRLMMSQPGKKLPPPKKP